MSAKDIVKKTVNLLPEKQRLHMLATGRGAYNAMKSVGAAYYDWRVFFRHSGVRGLTTQGVLEASIIKTYHRIEKGLALREPRTAFGRDAIELLIFELQEHLRRFGPNRSTFAAVNTLQEYLAFNQSRQHPMPELAATVANMARQHNETPAHSEGGTLALTREQIWQDARLPLKSFFNSRYSVRNFSDEPVPVETIEQAVRMAQKTPSVCNRQSGRVIVVTDRARIKQWLTYQNGNRGFGEQIDKLLVVTARLDTFLTSGERYQSWIDGGMFAMSLIWAMHSLGLGSCCMNWSVDPSTDRAFKAASGIPEDQSVIMMIAVGNLPAELRVAQSPRRPLQEVMQIM